MIPILLTLTLTAAAPPEHEADPKIPAEVKKAFYATTRIQNNGVLDARSASGVTIGIKEGNAFVLTANHALGQSSDLQVEFFHPDAYPNEDFTVKSRYISVVVQQPVADFALLKVVLPKIDGVPQTPTVARLAPQFDRPKRFPVTVFAAGCNASGMIEPPTLTVTKILGKQLHRLKNNPNDFAVFWETDSANVSGRSGGPLLDNTGRVIGICTANVPNINHGFFTHLDEIQAWLKKNGYVELFWENNR